MTLYALLLWAFTSSKAISDSDRMAAQFKDQPTLEIVSAPQTQAPLCPKGGLCND